MEGGVLYLFALLNFKSNKIMLEILCETVNHITKKCEKALLPEAMKI